MRYFSLFISIIFVTVGLIVVFMSHSISAHGVGQSAEQTIDGYLIDLGYDTTELRAGESVRLDYNIISLEESIDVDFTDVWVRIVLDRQTVFASGIHNPEFGLTGMTYIFSKPGDYNLNVRFQRDGKSIVEGIFQLTVLPGVSNSEFGIASGIIVPISLGVFGSLLGLLGGYLVGKRRQIIA